MAVNFVYEDTTQIISPMKSFNQDQDIVQLEMEKLRRWKVLVDMDLKKKSTTIQNLSKTVHAQRKSLVDVQMDYETTSAQLQSEIEKRKICLERINYTKNMCRMLKQQTGDMQSSLTFSKEFKITVGKEQTCQQHVAKVLSEEMKTIRNMFYKEKVLHLSDVNLCQFVIEFEKLQKRKVSNDLKNIVKLCRNNQIERETIIEDLAIKIQCQEKQIEKMALFLFSFIHENRMAYQARNLQFQQLCCSCVDIKVFAKSRYNHSEIINQMLPMKTKTCPDNHSHDAQLFIANKMVQAVLIEYVKKMQIICSQAHTSVLDMNKKLKLQTTVLWKLLNYFIEHFRTKENKQNTKAGKLLCEIRLACQNLQDHMSIQKTSKLHLVRYCKDIVMQNNLMKTSMDTIKQSQLCTEKSLLRFRYFMLKNNNNLQKLRLESFAGSVLNAYLLWKNSYCHLQIVLEQQLSLDLSQKLKNKSHHLKNVLKKLKLYKRKLNQSEIAITDQSATINVYSSYITQMTSIKNEQEDNLKKLRNELYSAKLEIVREKKMKGKRNSPQRKKIASSFKSQTLPKHSTPKHILQSSAILWSHEKKPVKRMHVTRHKKIIRNEVVSGDQSENWFENDKVFGFFE